MSEKQITKVVFRLLLHKSVLAVSELEVEHPEGPFWVRKILAEKNGSYLGEGEDVIFYHGDQGATFDLELTKTEGVIGFALVRSRAEGSSDLFGPTTMYIPSCLEDRSPIWNTTESLAEAFVYAANFRRFIEGTEDAFNPEMSDDD